MTQVVTYILAVLIGIALLAGAGFVFLHGMTFFCIAFTAALLSYVSKEIAYGALFCMFFVQNAWLKLLAPISPDKIGKFQEQLRDFRAKVEASR